MFLIGLFLFCFGISPIFGFIISSEIPNAIGLYVVALIVGIIFMAIGVILHKSRCESDTKANSVKERYCPNCNITVSNEEAVCPICKKNLHTEETKNGENNNRVHL